MNILYTCDNNYVWLVSVSMVSVFENNRSASKITIYLIGDDVLPENRSILDDLAGKYNRDFVYISAETINIDDSLCSERWPKSAYIRLFCANYLPPSVNEILYLDCDTIVKSELEGLLKFEKDTTLIRGVLDCVSWRYKRNIGLDVDAPYINAGVLLINVVLLRSFNIDKTISSFLDKYGSSLSFADQDILNGIMSSQIEYFEDPGMNLTTQYAEYEYEEIIRLRHPNCFYEKSSYESARNHPSIIHFTTCMQTVRPWYSNSDHMYRDVFTYYRKLTPYSDTKLKTFNSAGIKNSFFKLAGFLPKHRTQQILGIAHSCIKPLVRKVV